MIQRVVSLAICGLVFTGCVKSVTDEASPYSDESSPGSVKEPIVQTARESPLPAQSSTEVASSTDLQSSVQIESVPETIQPPAENSYSALPLPVIQTARAAQNLEQVGSSGTDPQSQIISVPPTKRVAKKSESSSQKKPLIQTGRERKVNRVGSAEIVAMQRVKRSTDGKDAKDFNYNGVSSPASGPMRGFSLGEMMKQVVLYDVEMDPRAHMVPENPRLQFSPDPRYTEPYNAQAQLAIYGAKHPNPTARPLIEAGRELYGPGTFGPGINLLGEKNLVFPQLLMYGDWRTAIAYNSPVTGAFPHDKGLIATKLDLDFDFKITGTERIHLFITPINDGARFTNVGFAGDHPRSTFNYDLHPQALFFEGDLARLWAGFTNEENKADIPFTFGLIPLLFQNGVWLEDAFNGFAFTIPARNSPSLDISNADITFFAGFDQVTTAAIPDDHSADVFGIATFVETRGGYLEFDYGYLLGRDKFDDLSYHNLSAAFTRRYFDTISNSVRVIYNFGQDPEHGERRTADGVLVLIENSLITPKPLTLVPYLDLFAGFNKPQSLARAGAAGGVLLNTGICFETDNLTNFPKMDDTGHDTWGGSFGIQYLFNLDQQIVVEVSGLDVFGDAKDRTAKGAQVGVGIRYQRNLNNAWLIRADLIAAERENDQDLFGIRMELRRKF